MEGRWFRYLHTHRVELLAFGFFLLSLVAGIKLLVYLLPDPPSVALVLPEQYSEHPDSGAQDFYTKELDCRISLDSHRKNQEETLDLWIDTDREQLAALTVLSREKKKINNNEKKILYTIVTAETGMSKIYYEDRENEIFEMRVFGEHPGCYVEFEQFILNR